MTKGERLEEILKEVLNTGNTGTFKPNEYGKKKIAQSANQIEELYRVRLPMKVGLKTGRTSDKFHNLQMRAHWKGWNDCIDETGRLNKELKMKFLLGLIIGWFIGSAWMHNEYNKRWYDK